MCNYCLIALTIAFFLNTTIDCTYLNQQWWKNTIIYEVFIKSFKDSDDDGIGDINGIISKLDYLKEMNIETLWISPFYESPMLDSGYDITNYTSIDPIFGTFADFNRLVSKLKRRDMKIILDLVINHSSDQHEWFNKSVYQIHPYTNYYIWKDPGGYDAHGQPIPPNNWISHSKNSSAWTWNEIRSQFYLHNYAEFEPDLNLSNYIVITEVKEIMKFWLDYGVDGFRLVSSDYYLEDLLFRDEEYQYQHRKHQPLTYVIIDKLKRFVDKSFSMNKNVISEKILIEQSIRDFDIDLNSYSNNQTLKTSDYSFHFNIQTAFIQAGGINVQLMDSIINKLLKFMPMGASVNWMTESHDLPRIGLIQNEEYMNLFVILSMTLPGTVTIYYGQEIGMIGNKMTMKYIPGKLLDFKHSSVSPMQWNPTDQAGFSNNAKTWTHINSNYWSINVELQKFREGYSNYKLFSKLTELRRWETMKRGDFKSFIISPGVYAFKRSLAGYETYVIFFNFNSKVETIDLKIMFPKNTPNLETVTSSLNTDYSWGRRVCFLKNKIKVLMMKPVSSLVAKTRP